MFSWSVFSVFQIGTISLFFPSSWLTFFCPSVLLLSPSTELFISVLWFSVLMFPYIVDVSSYCLNLLCFVFVLPRPSISLLFIFSVVLSILVIAHYSIFITASSFVISSHISAISLLAPRRQSFFKFSLTFSWFLI